jgi:SAM-dependent methyltransferase
MTFGSKYAGLYDALYADKDYVAEAAFALAEADVAGNSALVDFGCGTGLHAIEMAKKGFAVTGVDRSPDMIALAHRRAAALPPDLAQRLDFEVGDLCSTNLGRQFDAAFSLFHVICYMTDDAMLKSAFDTVRRHLPHEGVFLFDFWHADAVSKNPPERRERIVEADGKRIKRVTLPRWEPDRSLVHITYEMHDLQDGIVGEGETHSIRYFTRAELTHHLNASGFTVSRFGEWLTGAEPSDDSFGVYCVARPND